MKITLTHVMPDGRRVTAKYPAEKVPGAVERIAASGAVDIFQGEGNGL